MTPTRHRRARMLPLLLAGLLLPSACAPRDPGPAVPESGLPAPDEGAEQYVIMISFDGMRYDYLDRVPTPSFDRLAERGVRAAGLIPSYPSKTFPNHYSIATGLYAGHHGLVDNAFYDPAFEAVYALGDRESVEDGRWYGGEPIWETAERQGLLSASFFWVGSEAEGLHPTYWKVYDHGFPNAARVDTVLAWLDLPPERRPRLVMLYFSDVDGAAHRYGPAAPQVDSAIVAMDALMGRLMDGLDRLEVGARVNIIVVSDHGMAPVPEGNVVFLEDYADLEGVRVIANSTQALLYFDGDETRRWAVYDALSERIPHATVYFPEDLPHRWHYGDNPRVGEVIVTADPGWMVAADRQARRWSGGGMHGWDPYWRPMHGTFLAAGPGVRRGGELATFENVHIHPFAAALLGIEPAPGIDGRLEVLAPHLATTPAPSR